MANTCDRGLPTKHVLDVHHHIQGWTSKDGLQLHGSCPPDAKAKYPY